MEKYTPGNLVGHGKILQEVRRPMALRRGKVRLRRAQVAQVSPMSRLCRLSRARRANVALYAWYCRLDLHHNIGHCEATQDRVSTTKHWNTWVSEWVTQKILLLTTNLLKDLVLPDVTELPELFMQGIKFWNSIQTCPLRLGTVNQQTENSHRWVCQNLAKFSDAPLQQAP